MRVDNLSSHPIAWRRLGWQGLVAVAGIVVAGVYGWLVNKRLGENGARR